MFLFLRTFEIVFAKFSLKDSILDVDTQLSKFSLPYLLKLSFAKMSSSRNDQKSCDAEMGDTLHGSTLDSQAPRAVSTQIAEFLSFQTELDRREAEGSAIPKPDGASILPATTDALTSLAEVLSPHDVAVGGDETVAVIPPAEVTDQTSGSSTTPAPIVEPKLTSGLMPPATAKREIFLGQCAPSAAPLVPLKGRKRSSANPYAAKKRQCVKGVEVCPSLLGEPCSGLMPQHRTKVCSENAFCKFISSFLTMICVSVHILDRRYDRRLRIRGRTSYERVGGITG